MQCNRAVMRCLGASYLRTHPAYDMRDITTDMDTLSAIDRNCTANTGKLARM